MTEPRRCFRVVSCSLFPAAFGAMVVGHGQGAGACARAERKGPLGESEKHFSMALTRARSFPVSPLVLAGACGRCQLPALVPEASCAKG